MNKKINNSEGMAIDFRTDLEEVDDFDNEEGVFEKDIEEAGDFDLDEAIKRMQDYAEKTRNSFMTEKCIEPPDTPFGILAGPVKKLK